MVRPLNSIVGRVLLLVPAVWAALDVDINNEGQSWFFIVFSSVSLVLGDDMKAMPVFVNSP